MFVDLNSFRNSICLVKIATLIDTVSPSPSGGSISVKRKKEDNESENQYTPPCHPYPPRRSMGLSGLLRRSLSEITPNKGFKKPRMLSDSSTPLSSKSSLTSPNSSISSLEESPVSINPPVIVKSVTEKSIDDTPMTEEITSISDILLLNIDKLKKHQHQESPVNLQSSTPILALTPTPPQAQPRPQSLLQQPPTPSQSPIVSKPKPQINNFDSPLSKHSPLQQQPNQQHKLFSPYIKREPLIDIPRHKSTPKQEIVEPIQSVKPTMDSLELITTIPKEKPITFECGFKLASQKPLYIDPKAQRRAENLLKQWAIMDVDIININPLSESDLKQSKSKPIVQTQSEISQCLVKNIQNVKKSGDSFDMDTEDDCCDEECDEFLRTFDIDLISNDSV